MAAYDTYDVDVCTDCLMAAANGDGTDTALCNVPDGYHLVPGDGDPFFSWSACETCDDRSGGDRHPAMVMSCERVSQSSDAHPDYRATVNGVRMVLVWDPAVGTVLAPEGAQ